jgi:DNA-binding PadR family transcriptional regulator
MPRRKSGLSAAEYAIIGLVQQQPMHGYQVAREMAPNQGLGLICPLRLSNVYFLLGNLDRRSLIAVDHRSQDAYPPRTVYKATAAGEKAFDSWLRQPPTRLREVRLDFLLKLYFLQGKDSESLRELIEQQIDFCRRYLSEWEALTAAAEPGSFDHLALQSKLSAARGTLDWLLAYRPRLSSPAPAKGEKQP